MKYKAPNGYILESIAYPGVATYTCECSGIVDGVYYSEETTGSSVSPYIKQIKITRTVNNNQMEISIREASEAELIQYKQEVENNNLIE